MNYPLPPMPSEVRIRPDAERVWVAFCRWAGRSGHHSSTSEQLRWFLRGYDAGWDERGRNG